MYLKYLKKLYEIDEAKAKRFAEYLDKKVKIPVSAYERLDWMRCEILKDLPSDWQDYEIIYQAFQLETPINDRTEQIKDWNKEQQQLKKQTPEEKADRELNLKAITFYKLRFDKEPNPQRLELIKQRLIKYFSENPNQAWADREVYEDLLPPKEYSKKIGWTKAGDLLTEGIIEK